MVKSVLKSLFFASLLLLWSCSGSRNSTEEKPQFGDSGIQQQVDDLLDKIDDNPNNPEYRRQLATLYNENGRSVDALKTLEEALVFDPNDNETKYLYGEIADQKGDKQRAYTAYKEILQSASGNDYLDRIGPKFVDAFKVSKIVGTSANEAFASFSADGSKIIYQSDQDGNWDLFEFTISTQATVQLTKSPAHEETPVYHPSGNYITYTSTKEDHRNVDYSMKVRDIFIWDIANGRHTNATQNSSDDWGPKYSWNGQYIAFSSERDDLRDVDFSQLKGEIYIMEEDGRFQHRVSNNQANDGGAVVGPGSTEENSTVYYHSDETGKFEIYKTTFDGESSTQITFSPVSNDVSPSVSKSGDKIVFFSDRDSNYEIYMMNSDGSAQMKLTSNPADDTSPSFSPDGSKVLFHSNRSGNFDIYLMDLTLQSNQPSSLDIIANIDQALSAL